jgi:hypothetical protein
MHVSLTSIDYSNDKKNIEIAVKLNTEDIEFAIAHNYEVVLNLHKINELKESKFHIENYFSHVLQICINKKIKSALQLNRKESEDGSTWLYFDLPYAGKIKNITIKNAILLDVFMDQTNVTIISDNGNETGFKLDFNNRDVNYIPKSFSKLKK